MCASPTPRQIAQTTVWRTAPSLRRSVCLFTILASAVAACGSSKVKELEAQNEDLQEQIGSLKAKLEEVDGHVTELESAQSDLSDAVGRFELEDWRDVVPDVQSAAKDVESPTTEVRSAL